MASPEPSERDLLEALQRRALDSAPAAGTSGGDAPDLVRVLRNDEGTGGETPPDLTLIGYVARHDRPPAFTGIDDQPYTVDVDVERTGDPARPWGAFYVFVRWAQTGAGIMGHVESEDVAFGETEAEAKRAALDRSLYEVKAELDEAIRRRERRMEN